MPLLTMPEGPAGGQYPGPIGVPGGFGGYNGLVGPSFSRRSHLVDGVQQPHPQPQPGQMMPTLSSPIGGQPWPSATNNSRIKR